MRLQASFVLLPVLTISSGGDREDVVLQAAPRPAVASSVGCFPDQKKIDSPPNCYSVYMIAFMHIYLAVVFLTGSKIS